MSEKASGGEMSPELKHLEEKVSENRKELWADIWLFRTVEVCDGDVISAIKNFEAAVREREEARLSEAQEKKLKATAIWAASVMREHLYEYWLKHGGFDLRNEYEEILQKAKERK